MPASAPRSSEQLTETFASKPPTSEQAILNRKQTTKRLILSVLSQPNMSCLPISHLIAWGGLFDQQPAAIRVTAGRLVKEGLIEKTGRGMYTIGPGGVALKNKASEWTTVLSRIRVWNGGWLAVHTAHLGKTIRRKVRARERALRLLGFKEFVSGLWIRPDNLHYSVSEIRAKLCELGLESHAILTRSDDLSQMGPKNPLGLWSSEKLNANYEYAKKLISESQQQLEGKDLHTVTRETFLIGEHVIRQINADPLLPAEHIDAAQRDKMVQAMKRYSDFCHPYWAQFLEGLDNERDR